MAEFAKNSNRGGGRTKGALISESSAIFGRTKGALISGNGVTFGKSRGALISAEQRSECLA